MEGPLGHPTRLRHWFRPHPRPPRPQREVSATGPGDSHGTTFPRGLCAKEGGQRRLSPSSSAQAVLTQKVSFPRVAFFPCPSNTCRRWGNLAPPASNRVGKAKRRKAFWEM